MTGDVDMNGGMQDPKAGGYDDYVPDWRTLLVGTLGLGGKGYFVLDVTNPTATTAPSGITTVTATSGGIMRSGSSSSACSSSMACRLKR